MDPSSITLLAFSSVLVVGSCSVIIIVNFRRFGICVKKTKANDPVDWVTVSQNILPSNSGSTRLATS